MTSAEMVSAGSDQPSSSGIATDTASLTNGLDELLALAANTDWA
jgi:hypothetical protein